MFDQNRSSIHQKKSDAWKIKTLDQLDEPGQITYMQNISCSFPAPAIFFSLKINDAQLHYPYYVSSLHLGVDGRKKLVWTLKKQVLIQGIGLFDSEQGLLDSPCEYGIEPPGFISNEVSLYVYLGEYLFIDV